MSQHSVVSQEIEMLEIEVTNILHEFPTLHGNKIELLN